MLHEFAAKVNMEKPTYHTIQCEGLLPAFETSLVFNGENYTGGIGKSKKEAEQLAARSVIRSLLGILTAPFRMIVCFDITLGCLCICTSSHQFPCD